MILDMFTYGRKDVIWASYGDDWHQMRKLFALEFFNTQRLQAAKKIRNEEFSCAMHEIFKHCKARAHDFIFSLHFKFVAQFEGVA
jgi:hypothetical protein